VTKYVVIRGWRICQSYHHNLLFLKFDDSHDYVEVMKLIVPNSSKSRCHWNLKFTLIYSIALMRDYSITINIT
jgi:hypothetical protein